MYRIGSHSITPVGTLVVLVAVSVLAIRLLRGRWALLPFALAGAYIARRVGLDHGQVKWIDHNVLTRVSDTFDNIEWWLATTLVAVLLLTALHRWRRA